MRLDAKGVGEGKTSLTRASSSIRGEHAGARRLRRGAGVAQGDAMKTQSRYSRPACVLLLLLRREQRRTRRPPRSPTRRCAAIATRFAPRSPARPTSTRRRSTARTALHWAVERDDLEMADLLIRAGARVSGADARRRDAAAARGHQRQRADDRSAAQGRRRSERAADAGGRHGADDGGAHRQDRRDSRAASKRAPTSTRRRPGAARRR